MRVDFLVHGYTELRYLLPIAERIGQSHTMRAFVNRRTVKYNTVATQGTEKMRSLLSDRRVEMLDLEHPTGGDVLFSVEGVHPYASLLGDYQRIVAVQHAFDYNNPESHVDKNSLSVVWDEASALQIRNFKPNVNAVVAPLPTTFWNRETDANFARSVGVPDHSVLVFYPDQGLISAAEEACRTLVREGFPVFVKQRAKHQPIRPIPGTASVYDAVWYPSESIFLSANAAFCVGFGTGAYADTCAAGISFIDFPMPDYSKKYAKPDSRHFLLGDCNNIADSMKMMIKEAQVTTPRNARHDEVFKFFLMTVGEDLT